MVWDQWEDYQAGLYRPGTNPDLAEAAAAVLRDPDQFGEAAREMLREWPNAAEQNLSRMDTSRNAWLGQATCCYVTGASAADTKAAWGTLTSFQQITANRVADHVRAMWEREQTDAQALPGL